MRAVLICLAGLGAGCAKTLVETDGELIGRAYFGVCHGVDVRGTQNASHATIGLQNDAIDAAREVK